MQHCYVVYFSSCCGNSRPDFTQEVFAVWNHFSAVVSDKLQKEKEKKKLEQWSWQHVAQQPATGLKNTFTGCDNNQRKRRKGEKMRTVGIPWGLICSPVKCTAVQLRSKTLVKVWREIYLVERKSEERWISFKPLGILEWFHNFVCVSVWSLKLFLCGSWFFGPLPRVFTLSLCVFIYALRRHQGGKPGRKEKRKEKPDGRDEWIAEEAVAKRPLTPASPSSEVSSGFVFQMSMLAGGAHSTINKPWPQRNPKGPPAATGERAEQTQCQVKTPPPTPARQAGFREPGRRRGRWKRDAERKNETEWWESVRARVCEYTF